MQPIVRERDLHDLFTAETFRLPDPFEFGASLDEAIEWLPLSETMRPGEEAFDARKYVELPDNGFTSLRPFLYYSFPETGELELVMESNDEKGFYGFWLASRQYDVDTFSEEEKAAVSEVLLALVDVFEERSEPIVESGPESLRAPDWSYFEEGGQLRVFFLAQNSTFCQLTAGVSQGTFSFRVGIGKMMSWPGVYEAVLSVIG